MKPRLYRGDCKVIADELIREGVKVDLIYLDPPFSSNRTYSILFNHGGLAAQQKAYHDMWDFKDTTTQLVLNFERELEQWTLPKPFKDFMRVWMEVLRQGNLQDKKLLNYLMYMTERLIRLKKLLQPTGSIYFHCDGTASHYIKIIMDGIFGRENYRNQIIWRRANSHNDAKRWGKIHDTLLFYTNADEFTWTDKARIPYSPEYIKKTYCNEDSRGRYMTGPLHARGLAGGGYEYEYKGITDVWKWPLERLQELEANNLIHWPEKKDGVPRRKIYLDPDKGVPVQDVITDIAPHRTKQGQTKYETKKPNGLLKRIIEASSKEGDVVLDPFCGCGTTIEAAQELKRLWLGIDISGSAIDEIMERIAKHGMYENSEYDRVEGSPDTMAEYTRLNPYEKQDWLVRRLGGLPNPKKSGDQGIDGDMTFHLGMDSAGQDQWGKLVFSVKTGKQRNPAHVRELKGTMKAEKAVMGVLIVDADPTAGMEATAEKAGQLEYQLDKAMPPKHYDKVQIITASEIIEGGMIDCPPSMHKVREYRKLQGEMQV